MTARLPRNLRRRTAVHAAFEAAMNTGAPIVDMIGEGHMDPPGECTCPALPPGHDDADCAAATWERGAA